MLYTVNGVTKLSRVTTKNSLLLPKNWVIVTGKDKRKWVSLTGEK